jgi:hypothetical protein
MILVRHRNNNEPEIVIDGVEKDIIKKIHELNLSDWHDAFFYESGKFENLGLNSDVYDYYTIYTDIDCMNNLNIMKRSESSKSRGCCSECGEGYDNDEEWLYNTECELCGHPIPEHLIVKRT